MFLSRIIVYPIKALDGVSVEQARVTPGGFLENDRTFAIVDEDGAYVNGKRHARVGRLRAEFDDGFQEVSLGETGGSAKRRFQLRKSDELDRWLSDFFGFTAKLDFEPNAGFPDDRTAYGPTIVSEASLREVCGWYPGWTLESARRRFRTNLEVGGVPPFWEDCLFGVDRTVAFRAGEVAILGHNSCQRCVVPSRDPDTADGWTGFQKTFRERRQQELPVWADPRAFNHYYRFTTNTSVPLTEAGKTLRVGDPVCLAAEAGHQR